MKRQQCKEGIHIAQKKVYTSHRVGRVFVIGEAGKREDVLGKRKGACHCRHRSRGMDALETRKTHSKSVFFVFQ